MSTVALSGNDTVSINNTILTDLADGDAVTLDLPNDIMTAKIGKNSNAIFGQNQQGLLTEVKLRVIRGSADDKFLNTLLTQQFASPQTSILLLGEFVKLIGDGAGNVANDTYVLGAGVFKKFIPAKTNVDGDTAQSVSEYTMHFASMLRAIT